MTLASPHSARRPLQRQRLPDYSHTEPHAALPDGGPSPSARTPAPTRQDVGHSPQARMAPQVRQGPALRWTAGRTTLPEHCGAHPASHTQHAGERSRTYAGVLLGLAENLAQHLDSRSLGSERKGPGLRSLHGEITRTSKVTQHLLPEGPLALRGSLRRQGPGCGCPRQCLLAHSNPQVPSNLARPTSFPSTAKYPLGLLSVESARIILGVGPRTLAPTRQALSREAKCGGADGRADPTPGA